MRRQLRLRAVVERAAHRHAQVQARAAEARANSQHLAAQLAQCLERAAAARDARLAAVAGRAAEAVSLPAFPCVSVQLRLLLQLSADEAAQADQGLPDCMQVARAREAAAEAKLRAEMEASHRRLLMLQRLARAERAR